MSDGYTVLVDDVRRATGRLRGLRAGLAERMARVRVRCRRVGEQGDDALPRAGGEVAR